MGSDVLAERQAKAVSEGRVNSRGEDKQRMLIGKLIGGAVVGVVVLVPSTRTMYGPLTSATMTALSVYGTGALSC